VNVRQAHAILADQTDLELVASFQDGCQDALQVIITRYRRFARAKARSYFLVGADSDDVEQEALIGLYKAARDFRPEHQSSFRAFAELCITRQIITAIKTATRQKHQALNQYVSISGSRTGDDAGERAVEELIHVNRKGDDPADRLVAAERFGVMKDRLAEAIARLPEREKLVIALYYYENLTLREIGEVLGVTESRVSQLHTKAVLRLKSRLQADPLTESV